MGNNMKEITVKDFENKTLIEIAELLGGIPKPFDIIITNNKRVRNGK